MAIYHTDTEGKLSHALWRLLEQESFNDITVLQLCQEAQVGRRSFYRHYTGIRDVLEYGFRMKSHEFEATCLKCRDMKDMIGRSFIFFQQQKRYLSLLKRNNLFSELPHVIQFGPIFDDKLQVFMNRSHLPPSMYSYVANAIAATHAALLITWAENDFREDWRQITHFEMSMFSVMAEK